MWPCLCIAIVRTRTAHATCVSYVCIVLFVFCLLHFYFTFIAIYKIFFYLSIPFLLPAHNSTLIIVVLCFYFSNVVFVSRALRDATHLFAIENHIQPMFFVLLTVWNEETKTFSHLIGFRTLKCSDRWFLVHSNGVYYLRSCNVYCAGFPLAFLLSWLKVQMLDKMISELNPMWKIYHKCEFLMPIVQFKCIESKQWGFVANFSLIC